MATGNEKVLKKNEMKGVHLIAENWHEGQIIYGVKVFAECANSPYAADQETYIRCKNREDAVKLFNTLGGLAVEILYVN